ncbi:DUF6266 family protein [Kaistella sp.]|uniref:DUF6266 family protein n=1 Tax=Kaistella sp. TaxID=2782235 RepID=UPI002F91CF21
MGKLHKGILGGFSGTVGTVVGCNWRGKDIIRSRPKSSGKTPTEAQLLQRMKFRLVVGFLTPLQSIQQQFFAGNSGVKSRMNQAVSYHIREAVEVLNGEPSLVYNKVLITKGDLASPQNAEVGPAAGGMLNFIWEDNSGQANAAADDVFCTVIFCEELGIFSLYDSAATRTDLVAEQAVPNSMTGKSVHVYCYFRNAMAGTASTSAYLGETVIL